MTTPRARADQSSMSEALCREGPDADAAVGDGERESAADRAAERVDEDLSARDDQPEQVDAAVKAIDTWFKRTL